MIFTTNNKTLLLYNTYTLYFDEVGITDELKMNVIRRNVPFMDLDPETVTPADGVADLCLSNFGSPVMCFTTHLSHPDYPAVRLQMLFHIATHRWSVHDHSYALSSAFALNLEYSPWMDLLHIGFDGAKVEATVLNRTTNVTDTFIAHAHVRKRTVFILPLVVNNAIPMGESLNNYENGEYELIDVDVYLPYES